MALANRREAQMTAKQEPVAMQRSQMGEVTDALARSFFDDPFVLYISPEDERRRRGLDAFMHVAARYALRHGHIHTTPGDPLGGAIWLPPGEAPARTLGLLRAGMLAIVPRIGLAATMRMTKALNKMDDVHKKEMTRAHWYLWILGV